MSANHAKHFETRKASVEETARWMLPDVQRAENQGFEDVTVRIADVKELLAYVEAMSNREKVEFRGKRLGYAQPQAMRDLMSCKRNSIDVLRYPSKTFPVEVYFVELPPREIGDE